MIRSALVAGGVSLGVASVVLLGIFAARARWPLRAKGDRRPLAGLAVGLGLLAGTASASNVIPLLVLLGGAAILLVGALDDWIDLAPWQKLLGQAVAAGLAAAGLAPRSLSFFGLDVSLGAAAWTVPFLWVMALTNAVNLIDGLDGLAVTTVASPFVALLGLALWEGDPLGAVVAGAALGALVAFLPTNLPRARLLLGDAGAESLGYFLALLTLRLVSGRGGPTTWAAIPSLLLAAVPLADTGFAVLRRAARGRSILCGDEGHIHHRLARRFGSGRAVLLLAAASALCTVGGVLLWRAGT